MATLKLNVAEQVEVGRLLTQAFFSVPEMMTALERIGFPVSRIDQAGAFQQVAARVVEEAELSNTYALLLHAAREGASEKGRDPGRGEGTWPVLLPWAGFHSTRVRAASRILLLLNVNSTIRAQDLALPDFPSSFDLVLDADVLEQRNPSMPLAHQWPLVWERLEALGGALREHVQPGTSVHVFGQAPLPAFACLGFHLRHPALVDSHIYQFDAGVRAWVHWPSSQSISREEPGIPRQEPIFNVSELPLDPGTYIHTRDVLVVVVEALPYPVHSDILRSRQALKLPSDCACLLVRRRGDPEQLFTPEEGFVAAMELRTAIRQFRAHHGSAPIHLFLAGPAALAFLFGTQMNALGSFLLYNRSKSLTDSAPQVDSSFRGQDDNRTLYDLAGWLRS